MSFTQHITPKMLGMADTGERVRFLDYNGYPMELDRARQHFSAGQVLTVLATEIGGWSSTYSFDGFDGHWNTVMFEPLAIAAQPTTSQSTRDPGHLANNQPGTDNGNAS